MNAMQDRPPGPPLHYTYQPTVRDVCSGRGKKHWNLPGNVAFRNYIQTQVKEYLNRTTKIGKTTMVASIVHELRDQGYQFLKQTKEGLWYDIGDKEARDKVGHSLRDQVTAIRRAQAEEGAGTDDSSSTNQTNKVGATLAALWQRSFPFASAQPQLQQPHQKHSIPPSEQQQQQQSLSSSSRRRPSICLSDSGQESDLRRSGLETTAMFASFARRPSWIAGEQHHNNSTEQPQIEVEEEDWKYVDKFMEMEFSSADDEDEVEGKDEKRAVAVVPSVMEPTVAAAAAGTTTTIPAVVIQTPVELLVSRERAVATASRNSSVVAAAAMDDPTYSLMKGSFLSFDARMSTISNTLLPFRRSSAMSGRSSLRNYTTTTTTQPFRFSDVSMASEIFETSFSASEDYEPDEIASL